MSELYGLILAGGQSSRMGQDKAAIEYWGTSQSEACFQLLSQFCSAVYLSNRAEQADLPGHKGLRQIHDVYADIGPMGGLLSAFESHPDKAWLVLACDMPLVDELVIQKLVDSRQPQKLATVYRLSQADAPSLLEPLCAIYEPAILPMLWASEKAKKTGLRHILGEFMANGRIHAISADDERLLISINLQSEWDRVRTLMG